jgi:predicted DNA-binding protein (UPF0251 family)
MVRPKKYRWIDKEPEVVFYKPSGIPLAYLKEVRLLIDEFQALNLADLRGLYHKDASEIMGISRQTFARILKSGRKKIAKALSEGMAIRIEGGKVLKKNDRIECYECGHNWRVKKRESSENDNCPLCKSENFYITKT